MPINFMAIAARFEVQTQRLVKSISLVFERLGKWLKPRAKQIADIEQATRGFPILRFYNEALTAFLDPSQRGTLMQIEPPRSLLGSIGEGARRLVGGLERIPQAVREEFLIPNLISSINDILVAISASIDRYSRPTPALFDPNQPRHFLDIIGQGVLLFRATATSLQQVTQFAQGAHAVQQTWRELNPSTATAPETLDQRPAFERVDEIGQQLVLAILALPMLGSILQTVIEAVVLRVESKILDHFQGIERRVFNLREIVLNFFAVKLLNFSEKAIRFTIALSFIIRDNLRVYMTFGIEYARRSIHVITEFLRNFSTWMNQVTTLIQGWLQGMLSFLDVEVIDVMRLLGMPLTLLATTMRELPRVRLRDLLVENSEAIGTALIAAIEGIRGGIGPVTDLLLRRRIEALKHVIRVVTNDRLRRAFFSELNPGGTFQRPAVDFPNIFDAFFGAGSPPFADALRNTRDSLQHNIDSILGAGEQTLDRLGTRFAIAANQAAQLDPTRYQALAQTADQLASQLFGNQVTTHAPDRLAAAFEQALARGGFELFAQVIPIYVLEMERYWQEARTSEVHVLPQTPTSPHILARRQRLGRVEAPELVIRLPDRPLNSDLVQATATQFRQAINRIYRAGLERHQNIPHPN